MNNYLKFAAWDIHANQATGKASFFLEGWAARYCVISPHLPKERQSLRRFQFFSLVYMKKLRHVPEDGNFCTPQFKRH